MNSFSVPPAANCCPSCGAMFTCGMNAGDDTCWCAALPPLMPMPAEVEAGATDACLCPACLRQRIDTEPRSD